jgi:Putative Ig domain/IPT/TIG domain
MALKIKTTNIESTSLTSLTVPKITGVSYPNSATAARITGGETVTVNGSGFNASSIVYINENSCNTTYVSAVALTFTSPAKSVGKYNLYVYNDDGSCGIKPGGISFSDVPIWSTSSGSLGSAFVGSNTSITISASSDSTITYSVTSGTLPTGMSLNSSTGVISGVPTGSATTYNFTITATDVESQTTGRSFSIITRTGVELYTPTGKTKLLGLQFNSSGLTLTGSYTITATGTLTYQTAGGVTDSGYATGWGSGTYLKINQITDNNATRSKTYVAWYKGTQTASATEGNYSPGVPVFGERTGGVYWGLGMDSGKIVVSNGTHNRGTTSVNTGNWVMLAWVVKAGVTVDAYVNGVKEVTDVLVNNGYMGTQYIGTGYPYGGMQYPTALDAIQVIDSELTASEILSIYNNTAV